VLWRCNAKTTASFETSGSTYPATQRLIPENRLPDYITLKETQITQHSKSATRIYGIIFSEREEERRRSVL